jgi:hypothetical protein
MRRRTLLPPGRVAFVKPPSRPPPPVGAPNQRNGRLSALAVSSPAETMQRGNMQLISVARSGILTHFGSRGSVAVERGLLIMLLGIPLAVAGAIIGRSS